MHSCLDSVLRVSFPSRMQCRLRRVISSRRVARTGPTKAAVCFGGIFKEGKKRSYERILRYPNGDTRLIRYPAVDSEADPEMEPRDTLQESFLEPEKTSHKSKEFPSSPAELLKLLKSDAFQKAQEDQRKKIGESYEILETCPWETPVQLYVLAMEDLSSESSSEIYTLRTRIEQRVATDKLKKMFRGESYQGDFIQVERLTDGVISFFDLDNAERFQSLLEAEGLDRVAVCAIPSHQLFRAIGQSQAVVVLMHCHEYLPSIHELSTALKAQKSLEG